MIDPAICRGCDFWRKDSGGNFMCNYCVDVEGPSRTVLGQLTVCNVRQVGGEIKPRIRSHKYDTARKPKARLAWNTRAPILSAEEMEMLEGME